MPRFHVRYRSKRGVIVISRDRGSRPLTGVNAKSIIQCAVSGNDLALWWGRQLLQVQFAFVFENILEVEVM